MMLRRAAASGSFAAFPQSAKARRLNAASSGWAPYKIFYMSAKLSIPSVDFCSRKLSGKTRSAAGWCGGFGTSGSDGFGF